MLDINCAAIASLIPVSTVFTQIAVTNRLIVVDGRVRGSVPPAACGGVIRAASRNPSGPVTEGPSGHADGLPPRAVIRDRRRGSGSRLIRARRSSRCWCFTDRHSCHGVRPDGPRRDTTDRQLAASSRHGATTAQATSYWATWSDDQSNSI